jgi:hypothetical protein
MLNGKSAQQRDLTPIISNDFHNNKQVNVQFDNSKVRRLTYLRPPNTLPQLYQLGTALTNKFKETFQPFIVTTSNNSTTSYLTTIIARSIRVQFNPSPQVTTRLTNDVHNLVAK